MIPTVYMTLPILTSEPMVLTNRIGLYFTGTALHFRDLKVKFRHVGEASLLHLHQVSLIGTTYSVCFLDLPLRNTGDSLALSSSSILIKLLTTIRMMNLKTMSMMNLRILHIALTES